MRTHLLAFALTAVMAAPARGQGIQIDATSLSARHELLSESLLGASITKRIGGGGPGTLRIALDYSRGGADRTGTTCTGLIPPGGCPAEPLRDKSMLVSAGLGLDLRHFAAGAFSFIPTIDARLAWIDVATRGENSGDQIDASKRMLEMMVGGRFQWNASTRWALQAGADVGVIQPLTLVHIQDGYTPFEEGFQFHRLAVGGTWTPGR
jgi:hypothetical protein